MKLNEAMKLKPLSMYRRFTELSHELKLMHLLRLTVEVSGTEVVIRRWTANYITAMLNRKAFPNHDSFITWIVRRSFYKLASPPVHITVSGKRQHYRLTASHALAMFEYMRPLLERIDLNHPKLQAAITKSMNISHARVNSNTPKKQQATKRMHRQRALDRIFTHYY
ncbi:hypothetical protein [Thalassotalea litorea]|uniref:hypothetical protein n=1 Tax=Thalassotalea litorea TaxID=2020715 RepID=UPI0037351E67